MTTWQRAAVWAYGFGCVLAAVLALVGINAVLSARAAFTVDAVAITFIPMGALMAVVFLAQRRQSRVIPSLIPLVVTAAALLLFSMLNHGLPEYAVPLASAHLIVVAVGLGWASYIILRQNQQRAA